VEDLCFVQTDFGKLTEDLARMIYFNGGRVLRNDSEQRENQTDKYPHAAEL
jgi:hypothetical protein